VRAKVGKRGMSRDGILRHQFKKHSSLPLNAIYSPFYWQILKKSKLFSGFKNPYKKIHQTKNSILFHE
jgi:hypothetical protein